MKKELVGEFFKEKKVIGWCEVIVIYIVMKFVLVLCFIFVDCCFVYDYLVVSIYMNGGKELFCEFERKFFLSVFGCCYVMKLIKYFVDFCYDSEILEILFSYIFGCNMRCVVDVRDKCICGGFQGFKECCEERFKFFMIGNILECVKSCFRDVLDCIGIVLQCDIKGEMFYFYYEKCVQSMCICIIFVILVQYEFICLMRSCFDVEMVCDCDCNIKCS